MEKCVKTNGMDGIPITKNFEIITRGTSHHTSF
jgi:hypothetical protein